jgi:hypothetical protein
VSLTTNQSVCLFFLISSSFPAATSMKWIEVKMKELGVTTNPNYKLCFMLDSLAMISIHTPKYGVIEVCIYEPGKQVI